MQNEQHMVPGRLTPAVELGDPFMIVKVSLTISSRQG
jgi:hypothetical protein